jgi:dTDP-4-dehydrorhamnose reductase
MKILLTGVTGQLGGELLDLLSSRAEVTCISRTRPSFEVADWRKCDFEDIDGLDIMLNHVGPDLIVNAAAYTSVDLAETESELAYKINARLPGQLALWCQRHGARLIHYSTDYVFDGKAAHAYQESDKTNPQSVYGKSKLAGETAITQSGCQHAVIRTAWVYSSHGRNFVLSMLNLAHKNIDLKIVDDQVGSPTSAKNLALATDKIIQKWSMSGSADLSGIYHYRDDDVMSWYGFAVEIFRQANRAGLLDEEPSLLPILGTEFPQAASRPGYSVLDCNKIGRDFDIQPASFLSALQAVIDELPSSRDL